jgi:hypothetical protein
MNATTTDLIGVSNSAKGARYRGLRSHLLVVGAVLAIALCMGCATTPQSPPDETSQLLASGFKAVPATTKQQQEHLQSLMPGTVTAWQRTGKLYFVYPDVSRNQLYVGTQKEYAAFRRLAPNAGPTLAAQQSADIASYNKQDEAMQARTQRDLADPYYFWRTFDDLGWR